MNKKIYASLVVVLAALVGSTAVAQNASGEKGKQKEVQKLAKEKRSLVDEDVGSLSNQQKLNRAKNKIKRSKKALEQTNTMLQDAREKEKDIEKINCINDKIAAIKGFLKVAEQSYVKLKKASSQGDKEASNHHYTLVSISNQKIGKLTEEARLCAGQVERYAEGTNVEVDVDDEIADEPQYMPEGPSSLQQLPELTPFQ